MKDFAMMFSSGFSEGTGILTSDGDLGLSRQNNNDDAQDQSETSSIESNEDTLYKSDSDSLNEEEEKSEEEDGGDLNDGKSVLDSKPANHNDGERNDNEGESDEAEDQDTEMTAHTSLGQEDQIDIAAKPMSMYEDPGRSNPTENSSDEDQGEDHETNVNYAKCNSSGRGRTHSDKISPISVAIGAKSPKSNNVTTMRSVSTMLPPQEDSHSYQAWDPLPVPGRRSMIKRKPSRNLSHRKKTVTVIVKDAA